MEPHGADRPGLLPAQEHKGASISGAPLAFPPFVTPAQAGVHLRTGRLEPWVREMDSRSRGNDGKGSRVRPATRFAGYAALFDTVDRGGDVVKPGAFAHSLAAGRRVPLLYGHNPLRRIGEIECLAEDERGLRVIARLHDWTPAARGAAAMLRAGSLTGLSFGYCVRAMEAGAGRARRTLTRLDLVEISLVPTPMQPKARVHMVG